MHDCGLDYRCSRTSRLQGPESAQHIQQLSQGTSHTQKTQASFALAGLAVRMELADTHVSEMYQGTAT